jgi:hypothetical protein
MNDADKQARGSRIGERIASMKCNCGKTFLDRGAAVEHARECDEMPHIGGADNSNP